MTRFLNFLVIVITAFICFSLYSITHEAQERASDLARLEDMIEAERRAILVLKAEWSHLSQPGRIQKLASIHLGLAPVSAATIASFSDIHDRPVDATMIAALPDAAEADTVAMALPLDEDAPVMPRRKPENGVMTAQVE